MDVESMAILLRESLLVHDAAVRKLNLLGKFPHHLFHLIFLFWKFSFMMLSCFFIYKTHFLSIFFLSLSEIRETSLHTRLDKAVSNGHNTSQQLLTLQKHIVADTMAVIEHYKQEKWEEVQRVAAAVLRSQQEDEDVDGDETEDEVLISVDDTQISITEDDQEYQDGNLIFEDYQSQDTELHDEIYTDHIHRFGQATHDFHLFYSRFSE